ncbi:MAG: transposase [Candidatus Pacebacteria bacterium]|nr:transposase [Candidatus Paceibacterota bacterium]
MSRLIAIRHQRKRTASGEARPTQVMIFENGSMTPSANYELEDEQGELDFLLGKFPLSWEKVAADQIPEHIAKHHRLEIKDSDLIKVPSEYVGYQAGDTVLSILGGSGDRFCYALTRRGQDIGAEVYGLAPFNLKKWRDKQEDQDKENDCLALVHVWYANPEQFYVFTTGTLRMIAVREAYRARQEAQRERIKAGNRLSQRAVGAIFMRPDGHYEEGLIEDQYDALKATDVIFKTLVKEEKKRESELKALVHDLPIWKEILGPIEGMGEVIAAGIISSIGDIRRFETDSKLKKFCGAHVLPDGRFPRRRGGEVANWQPSARQALYQFSDQMNRRPDSVWGQKLLTYKANLRAKHPEVEIADGGKKRYTDGHIHKMAIWRAITRFVEALHRDWTRLEKRLKVEAKAEDPAA